MAHHVRVFISMDVFLSRSVVSSSSFLLVIALHSRFLAASATVGNPMRAMDTVRVLLVSHHACVLSVLGLCAQEDAEVRAHAACRSAEAVVGVTSPAKRISLDEVESLLAAVLPALSSAPVAEDFLRTIAHMCDGNDGNKAKCVTAGAVEAVVTSLQANAHFNGGVAKWGCYALGKLCSVKEDDATASQVLACGGLDAIYFAMSSHPYSKSVQFESCYSLFHLSNDFDCKRVMRAGAAKVLLETAVKNFPEGSSYQTVAGLAREVIAKLDRKKHCFCGVYC